MTSEGTNAGEYLIEVPPGSPGFQVAEAVRMLHRALARNHRALHPNLLGLELVWHGASRRGRLTLLYRERDWTTKLQPRKEK